MPHKGASRSANGAGSIRKKTTIKNGKEYSNWEGRITIGYDPQTGKQIQKTVTGKSQREVTQKMQALAVEVNQGTYVEPSKMTVEAWLSTWILEYLGDVKKSSADLYSWSVRKYIIPALGTMKLSALTAPAIQAFYNGLARREKPLASKTIKNIHGIIHKALQQAVQIGYIRTNPADACKPPRVGKKQIRPLEEDQVSAFLKEIEGHRHEYLYKIALFTGLREGEVLGLTWDRLDTEHGTLLIDRQLQKEKVKGGQYRLTETKNSEFRTLTLPPSVLKIFEQQREFQETMKERACELWADRGLVFTNEIGGYLSYRTVYDCYKRIVKKLGIPTARFHDLRHTYATMAIKGGDDIKTVQENLGHATAAFTLNVYGHVTAGMRQASADRMEKMIHTLVG